MNNKISIPIHFTELSPGPVGFSLKNNGVVENWQIKSWNWKSVKRNVEWKTLSIFNKT